jgi:hypothetical protein
MVLISKYWHVAGRGWECGLGRDRSPPDDDRADPGQSSNVNAVILRFSAAKATLFSKATSL